MTTHFLVHDSDDNVGVVSVEDIEAGQTLNGWLMDTNETITIEAKDPIPLGHKIALIDFKENDTVIKYGQDIGRTVAPIGKGHHAHVNNVKTKRW